MADWQRITAAGADFELKALQVGTFENVVYIVRDPDTKEGYVIDAGWEPEKISAAVDDTKVTAILITHGHWDHHDQLDALKQQLGAPSAIGELDQGMLKSPPERLLVDRQELPFGKNVLKAIHTPGHTPGSTCFTVGNLLFSGDTLFPGGVGATFGDAEKFAQLIDEVETKVFGTLPDDTWFYPGHGKDGVLGDERPHLAEWRERGW